MTKNEFESFQKGVEFGPSEHNKSLFDSTGGHGIYFALHPDDTKEHGGDDGNGVLVKCLAPIGNHYLSLDFFNKNDDCRLQNLIDAHILVNPKPAGDRDFYNFMNAGAKNILISPESFEAAAERLRILIVFRPSKIKDPKMNPYVVDKHSINFSECVIEHGNPFRRLKLRK